MNVIEASVTLHEAQELLLCALTADDLDAAKSAVLQAINQVQRFRCSWFDRVRTVRSRHPPRLPLPPTRSPTMVWELGK